MRKKWFDMAEKLKQKNCGLIVKYKTVGVVTEYGKEKRLCYHTNYGNKLFNLKNILETRYGNEKNNSV